MESFHDNVTKCIKSYIFTRNCSSQICRYVESLQFEVLQRNTNEELTGDKETDSALSLFKESDRATSSDVSKLPPWEHRSYRPYPS